VLASRIGYAMRQCVGQMRHFPELWYVPPLLCLSEANDQGITYRITMSSLEISRKPSQS
jgi:hypothetical protein